VLAFAAAWGGFGYSSVCTTCGAEQRATDWQLPLTRVTYWRSRSVSETPLSRAIARDGLAGPHEHTWAFANGGGNGVTCAIGEGRHIETRSELAAAFLDGVTRYRGADEGRRWAALLLKPEPHLSVRVITEDFPRAGFATREGFERWWGGHRQEIDWLLNPSTADAATPATSFR
jgi:hypothetical protein